MPASEQHGSRILGVVKQLRPRDRVTVECADKTRTLTVTTAASFREREPYRCDAHVLTLEGYGTKYRLDVPARVDGEFPTRPTLYYPSSSALGEIVKNVSLADGDLEIVAENTAADLGIPLQ